VLEVIELINGSLGRMPHHHKCPSLVLMLEQILCRISKKLRNKYICDLRLKKFSLITFSNPVLILGLNIDIMSNTRVWGVGSDLVHFNVLA
jgi:hypothetical protein